MSDQSLLPEITKVESVVILAKEYLPKMEAGSAKAVARMQAITEIIDDEDYENVETLLVGVRNAYTKMYAMRTEMTGVLDEMKKNLMSFERPLSDDKTSEYTRLRTLMSAFKQKQIDDKKKLEQAAAKKKERENHFVDIGAAVLTNLNNMVLAKTKKADTDSDAYFKASVLENFDVRAERYSKMKPSLKPEDYNACFVEGLNRRFDLWTEPEWVDIITTLKKAEPIEKWTDEIIKNATPILNEWRAKIPDLKKNLIDLQNAKNDEERKRLESEQQAKAEADKQRRDRELEQQSLDKNLEISSQASLSKLENDFVEQATTQAAGATGPTKQVLKFTDPKKTLKALSTIMYHSMAHKDFPGIEKRDNKKQIVKDAQGRPEYIEAVQFWINFFMANCDADVEGTEIFEIAKTIIRK